MGNKHNDVNDAGAADSEVAPDDHVRADLYRDNPGFGQTLTSALTEQMTRDNSLLKLYEDNQNAPPFEIVGAGQSARLARADHTSRPTEFITAYDDAGKPHRFQNQPIEKLPVDMSGIPDWRVKQISTKGDELIKKYTEGKTPDGNKDGKLSFNDIGNMMKDIGKMPDLTEVEKCRLWTDIRLKIQKNSVPILDADEKAEMIDSWKGSGDPYHALITMDDGYHGSRLINMEPEAASKAIQEHEHGAEAGQMPLVRGAIWKLAYNILGPNTGDINASEGQLKALRELRSKGTFSAYADEWTRQFVREDRDQYGRPR